MTNIDDMINAKQQAQPGFRRACGSEKEITKDEIKEADTPQGKEDVRIGTEEAAAEEDKAKAAEELGKAEGDEERAEESAHSFFSDIPEDPVERAEWEKAMGYDMASVLEGFGVEPTPEAIEEFKGAMHPGATPNIDDLIAERQARRVANEG